MHPTVKYYLDRVVIRDGEKWIDENVSICRLKLKELHFHDININGYFDCSENNLTSLEGSPKSVTVSFYSAINKLKTLEGAPRIVGNNFIFYRNKLKTLEGAPELVGRHLDCTDNPLISLKGVNEVKGHIYTNKKTDCDYFLQYSLMDKIRLVDSL